MIAATLHGGSYFTPNHDETSIEVFPSIAEAIAALIDREAANGSRAVTFDTLDGKHHLMQFPCFDEGMRFECYQLNTSEPVVDELHEDTVTEALAAVHGGHRDWTLTLARDENDVLGVMVISA